jgi:MFS family permease
LPTSGVTSVEGQTLWSGAINAAGAGAMAITAPIWGLIADRFGRKADAAARTLRRRIRRRP